MPVLPKSYPGRSLLLITSVMLGANTAFAMLSVEWSSNLGPTAVMSPTPLVPVDAVRTP